MFHPLRLLGFAAATVALVGCRTALFEPDALDALLAVSTDRVDLEPVLRRGDWVAENVSDPTDASRRWRFQPHRDAATATESGGRSKSGDLWPPVDVETGGGMVLDDPAQLRKLAEADGMVGWNAAIVFAQHHPNESGTRICRILQHIVAEAPEYDPATGRAIRTHWYDRLWPASDDATTEAENDEGATPVVASVPVPESMRAAAAEAWVHVLVANGVNPVDALGPVGRWLEQRDVPMGIRADLYRLVSRWVPPSKLPHIDMALGRATPAGTPLELKRSAIEACLVHAVWNPTSAVPNTAGGDAVWPTGVDQARHDGDPTIRRTYAQWAATIAHPDALATLRRQLTDREESVQRGAVTSLGVLGTDEARDELRKLAERSDQSLRLYAIVALAEWGPDEVEPYVTDPSYHARRAVAEALAGTRERTRAARLLVSLVRDRSPRVEAAAIAAVSKWPLADAGPVLLRAMEEGALRSREQAYELLGDQVESEPAYDSRSGLDERRAAVREIAERLRIDLAAPFATQLEDRHAPNEDRLRELRMQLGDLATAESADRRLLWDRLRSVTPDELPAFERMLENGPPDLVDEILTEVLAESFPVYRALRELRSDSVNRRREAALQLAQPTAGGLSPFVLRHLHDIVYRERDRIVWARVHQALREDGSEPVARIMRLALEAEWRDLQRLGCEYIADHPRPHRGEWLLPLFRETDPEVLVDAIRAAGRCGNPVVVDGRATEAQPIPLGVRSFLTHEHPAVRIEAAATLSVLGHEDGFNELAAFSRSSHREERHDALVAMGETAHPAFVDTLREAARNERDPRLRQIAIASLQMVVDRNGHERGPSVEHAPEAALRSLERRLDGSRSPRHPDSQPTLSPDPRSGDRRWRGDRASLGTADSSVFAR